MKLKREEFFDQMNTRTCPSRGLQISLFDGRRDRLKAQHEAVAILRDAASEVAGIGEGFRVLVSAARYLKFPREFVKTRKHFNGFMREWQDKIERAQ